MKAWCAIALLVSVLGCIGVIVGSLLNEPRIVWPAFCVQGVCSAAVMFHDAEWLLRQLHL